MDSTSYGFRINPLSQINDIRNLLRDRYHSGFPILKELIQNADDASATVLHIGWCEGLANATHPLLRGPALFVVNNSGLTAANAQALPSGGYLILVGLFKPVRNLDRFPSRHVKIRSFTEDSIEQTGCRQEAISAFLTESVQDIENTGGFWVATPHRQHHFVSVSLMQKLHRRSEPGAGSVTPVTTINTTPSARIYARLVVRRGFRDSYVITPGPAPQNRVTYTRRDERAGFWVLR